MRESGYFTNRCRDALLKAFPGSEWMKRPGGRFAAAGVSDLVGCVPAIPQMSLQPFGGLNEMGLHVTIELKRPGGGKGLSLIQRKRMDRTIIAGGISIWADSPDGCVGAVMERITAKGWTPRPS